MEPTQKNYTRFKKTDTKPVQPKARKDTKKDYFHLKFYNKMIQLVIIIS